MKKIKTKKKLLWSVLLINFAFFIIEMTTGIISKSMGLVADSLDMLADSFVYGISLFSVGGTMIKKKRIAKLAGYFQITLAIIGFVEVLRRFFGDEKLPNFSTMIIVSIFALIANGTDIHLASGQEKHLPHEAWHEVQQKQGRVKPTSQIKGKVNVNDDLRLKKEADVMGQKTLLKDLDESRLMQTLLKKNIKT